MGTLKPVGQVDIHVDVGHRGLVPIGAVQHIDGISNAFYTHLLNIDISVVSGALNVFHPIPSIREWTGPLGFSLVKHHRKLNAPEDGMPLITGKPPGMSIQNPPLWSLRHSPKTCLTVQIVLWEDPVDLKRQ